MGKIWIPGGGGGGVDLDVVTAAADDVLSGKVIVDKDGEPLTGTLALSGNAGAGDVLSGRTFYSTNPKSKAMGTMTNRGAWNGTCGTNGSVTIPAGYHNGGGKVTNSQATMAGGTYTPSTSQQTISCKGKLMTGNIVINARSSYYKAVSGEASTSGSRGFAAHEGGTDHYPYLQIACNFTPKFVAAYRNGGYLIMDYGMCRLNASPYHYYKVESLKSGNYIYLPVPTAGKYSYFVGGYY